MGRMQKPDRRRSGQSLVEFALVLPVLMMILMGIIEFGRIWMSQNAVTNAAREGVRLGVLATADDSSVTSTANTYLSSAGLNTDEATITTANVGASGAPGSEVSVTVEYDFRVIVGDILGLDRTLTLSSTSVMRHE